MASDSELIFVTPDIEDPSFSIFRSFLDKLTDKYYAVKYMFDNGNGLAVARRMVVDYACSPYIVWVDGDQTVPPTFLQRHYEFMENNPDCGACNVMPLWVGSRPHQILEGLAWLYYTLKLAEETEIRRLGSIGGCYRVEAIRQAGNYDPRFRIAAEDGYITYRIWRCGWKLKIDAENYYYHIIRPKVREIMKEYRGWGYGAFLETSTNTGKKLDKRILKFMFSPVTGLKYGIIYRRFVKTNIYKMFRERATKDGVNLPMGLPLNIALFNIPYYTLKRYAWIIGYFNSLKRYSI